MLCKSLDKLIESSLNCLKEVITAKILEIHGFAPLWFTMFFTTGLFFVDQLGRRQHSKDIHPVTGTVWLLPGITTRISNPGRISWILFLA